MSRIAIAAIVGAHVLTKLRCRLVVATAASTGTTAISSGAVVEHIMREEGAAIAQSIHNRPNILEEFLTVIVEDVHPKTKVNRVALGFVPPNFHQNRLVLIYNRLHQRGRIVLVQKEPWNRYVPACLLYTSPSPRD